MKFNAIYAVAALAAGSNARPQAIPSPHYTQTHVLVGNGSPRQAYLYEQTYTDGQCGREGMTCSVTQTKLKTSTVGWSLGISGIGKGSFISAGYSVLESTSHGFSATCMGGGDTGTSKVCVWGRIAHTGYEVDSYKHLAGTDPASGEHLGRGYIWAPNKENGHGYVCAHDSECWDEGAQWWGYKSKGDALFAEDTNASGPTKYVWGWEHEARWN